MKTRKSIEKQLFELSEEDTKNLKGLVEDINSIISRRRIEEATITKLTNVLTVLTSFKDNYMWRLLNAAKQNHMID